MKADDYIDSFKKNTLEWKEFACGWGAAFVNITITYPVYKIIFRQMLHGVQLKSAFNQIRSEGITYLYRGIFPPLAQKTISLSLMFGVYDGVKRPLIEKLDFNIFYAKIIAGGAAGTVETILMPFERIQTLLADAKYHKNFKNTPHAIKVIWLNYGIREFYRGIVPVLYRNGPSNACFFILREEADKLLPRDINPVYRHIHEFLAGALIGAFISSLFYPLNVIKIAMQCKIAGPKESMMDVLVQVYNERGKKLSNVYKGVGMNCTRAFFSWGIMNAAYEGFKNYLY